MPDGEDWLHDPLIITGRGSFKRKGLKRSTKERNASWWSFHFSTRLKLDGADYFCRQVLGAASRPDDLGLSLLAHRQLKWYLDAFFFELMSAYDTLLQELNIVYDLGLATDKVRWETIKDKLPEELVNYMEKEWRREWFKKVRQYRNTAAHHSYIWTGSGKLLLVDSPWHYTEHEVSIYHLDDAGNAVAERIGVCRDLLGSMIDHIHQVWQEMAHKFTKRPAK